MPKGSPGQRRGRRGPNKPPAAPKKRATKKKAPAPAPEPPAELERDPAARERRRAAQVAEAMKACRLKNPGARGIAQDSLESLLLRRDLYTAAAAAGDLTSEEGAVANAVDRNTMKLLGIMGVDALRDEDDCDVCMGRGTVDGDDCEACDGMGVID